MRVRHKWLIAVVVMVAAATAAATSRQPTLTELIAMADAPRSPVAVGGYDPVSYFDGAAARGDAQFTTDWNGQRWQFVSSEHRDRFVSNPTHFAPAFGGHCAFAMSLGKVADASPTSWLVSGDTLYLQQNAVARFLFRALPGRLAKAHATWARIRGSRPA